MTEGSRSGAGQGTGQGAGQGHHDTLAPGNPQGMTLTQRRDTIGIVGAGAFGTALGSVLARAGRRVVLWSRDPAVVESIAKTRTCPRLAEAPLPAPLEATADPR